MKKWILLVIALLVIAALPVLLAPEKKPSLILQAAGVFVSSVIAASAIWGDYLRAAFAGPRLKIALRSDEGSLTEVTGGAAVRFYHIWIVNKRSAAIARNTRMQIRSIQRAVAGNWGVKQESYGVEPKWVFSDSAPKNIAFDAMCDIVSIYETGDCWISSYIYPNNLDLQLRAGDAVRLEVVAVAENAKSNTLSLEISWDGQWSPDSQVMKTHFVVKEMQ